MNRFPVCLTAVMFLSAVNPGWTGAVIPPAPPADLVPCKIHQRARIQFPQRMLEQGVTEGEVSLLMDVDRAGQLVDVLVVAHTRQEFADAAVDAVKRWRYTPSRMDGEPVNSTITLDVQFKVHGVLAFVRPIGATGEDDAARERFAYRSYAIDELDRVPAVIEREAPIYPREWIRQGRVGTVTVDFFVDEEGRVRFPRVVEQPDDFLGAAAMAALREWQFETPLYKGRPVLLRTQQVFHFRPETTPANRGASAVRRDGT